MLNEQKMRELGFTDRLEGWWYKCYSLDKYTTLNLKINKETGEWKEDVLNEMFCQPEYYYSAIPSFKNMIIEKVDKIIEELQIEGLPFEVNHEAYRIG